ncbi:MAG: RtcB family protein [Thermoprotei archaeon]|jgi:tRNA-splicing ligase RtcB
MVSVPLVKVSENIWEIPMSYSPDMRVPVRVYASEELLSKMRSDRTLWQASNVAKLPGIQKFAVVMPDGHEGYGFPVGGVAAFNYEEGIVSPGGIGYDINCGVRLIRTNLTEKDVRPKLKQLVDLLYENIPSGVGSEGRIKASMQQLDEILLGGAQRVIEMGYGWDEDKYRIEEYGKLPYADPSKVSITAKRRGAPETGTLGSGNHFLEVDVIRKIYDEEAAKAFGLFEGQVTILIHCGSRGLGHQVCSDYLKILEGYARQKNIRLPDRELAYAFLKDKVAQDYIGAMASAANFAFANRQFITYWVRETFEKVFGQTAESLGMHLVYDVAHNILKIEEHDVNGKRLKLAVHRKGATRSFPKDHPELIPQYKPIGQPVLIPGSMGTASWVLVGNEQAMQMSFGSTAHGAGRTMSRAAATRTHNYRKLLEDLNTRGIYIRAENVGTVVEEAPDAYKNVDEVVEVTSNVGIARKVARLTPIGVVKG